MESPLVEPSHRFARLEHLELEFDIDIDIDIETTTTTTTTTTSDFVFSVVVGSVEVSLQVLDAHELVGRGARGSLPPQRRLAGSEALHDHDAPGCEGRGAGPVQPRSGGGRKAAED